MNPDLLALTKEVEKLTVRVKKLEDAHAYRPRLGRVIAEGPPLEIRLDDSDENVRVALKADGSTPAPGDLVKVEWVGKQLCAFPIAKVT